MTKRLSVLGFVVGLMLAIPLSHNLIMAKKAGVPPTKVSLCHFPDDSVVGHVISVSANAVAAHLSKHGDCVEHVVLETGGCRCLTCQESCQAADVQCRAECDPADTICLAACAQVLTTCLAACEPIPPPGG